MADLIFKIGTKVLKFAAPIPMGTGEANTAANVGTGDGVFRDKVGAVLNLRSIKGTGGITTTISGSGDEVEIDGSSFAGGGPSGVFGPASSTDEAIARWDGAGGGLLQDGLATVDDSGNIATPGTVDGRDVSVDGAAQDAHIADTSNPHAVTAAQAAAIPLSEKGAANGVATLDAGSQVPDAQIPATITRDTELAAHTADTGNPHSVTPTQVGNTNNQWNADKLQGRDISPIGPVSGQFLAYDGAEWEPVNLPGGGDVIGPNSSVNNALTRFDGTTGKVIQESDAFIDDVGNLTLAGTVDGRDVAADGTAQDSHIADTANPHATDIENLGSGTLAELNAAITDATLDDSAGTRDPNAHATAHEDAGADEINVAGLSGLLADAQNPTAHAIGGAAHSSDTLANINTKISDATLDDSGDPRDPNAHNTSHQNGGSDEISVVDLSGLLADPQTPATHVATHEDGGADEIDVTDLSGLLADQQLALSPGRTIIVAKANGDATTLTAGLALLNALVPAPSVANPASMIVYPGTYTEAPLTIPTGASFVGIGGREQTVLLASTTTAPFIIGSATSLMRGFTVNGANGVGGVGLSYISGATGHWEIFDVEVHDCETLMHCSGMDRKILCGNVELERQSGQAGTIGMLADGGGRIDGLSVKIECEDVAPLPDGVIADGAGSSVHLIGYEIEHCTSGVHVKNGGEFHGTSGEVSGCTNAARINTGGGELLLTGFNAEDSIAWDILIEDTAGVCHISSGVIDNDKVAVVAGAQFLASYFSLREGDEALQIQGELHVGSPERPKESAFGEGDSHTRGMFVFRNTNGEAGAWSDITTEMASHSGSTADLFPGAGIGSTFYVGGDQPFPGLKIDLTAALGLGTGTIVREYWSGAAWTSFLEMSSDSDAPYGQYADQLFERPSDEQVRFGLMSGWVTRLLNGETKYWMRVRVTAGITTIPTAEQIKIHTNRTEINKDGVAEFFGAARPERDLLWRRNLMDDVSGEEPTNGNIAISPNILISAVSNVFNNNAIDARAGTFSIPDGIDTGFPLKFVLTWKNDAVGGDVEWNLVTAVVKEGDLINGTLPEGPVLSQIKTVGALNTLEITEFEIDASLLIPGDILALRVFRDGRAGNPDDTLAGSVTLVNTRGAGIFWR